MTAAMNADQCSICDDGYYMDTPGHCSVCPNNLTTYFPGSVGISSCSACKKGFYGNGTPGCITCPTGYSTPGIGASSVSECNTCAEGFSMIDGVCTSCRVGFFCPGGNEMNMCPYGMTTSTTGSSTVSDCVCSKGFYASGDHCFQCQSGKSTPSINSTSYLQCSVCDTGYEKVDGICTFVCRDEISPGYTCCMERVIIASNISSIGIL